MKIAIGQINPKIGDFSANCHKILRLAEKASAAGADLAVFSELAVCGYPPMDLLRFPEFLAENLRAMDFLCGSLPPGLFCVIGHVRASSVPLEKSLENAVSVIHGGRIVFSQAKTLLPTYDVFDERRYFAPSERREVFDCLGVPIGIAICEDLWWEVSHAEGNPYGVDPVVELAAAGARLILSPAASPYFPGKKKIRLEIMEKVGRKYGVPVVYVNQVGGNDGLIFDGGAMVTDAAGKLVFQAPSFEEGLHLVEEQALRGGENTALTLREDRLPDLEAALVLGIRDYLYKCGFKKAHLGLSGGIDSAVVACLAVKALGADHVSAFAMPSRYSSQGSLTDARALAENLGIPLATLPIEDPFKAFLGTLSPLFEGLAPDVTEENIQARIRGVYLMAYSNKTGSMLLTTGNKSELACGYCTLYGDMAGGLAVIGDLFKTEVYELAKHLNRDSEIIPWTTYFKPPSAELRPGQKDEDSLPPYEVLDAVLSQYLIEHRTMKEIIAAGFEETTVARVLKLVASAEYKRWQAPPVLKVSALAFGTGRRFPLARSYFELFS